MRIAEINARPAILELIQDNHRSENVELALNQSLTLQTHQGVVDIVGVREGLGAVLTNTLRKTRLP